MHGEWIMLMLNAFVFQGIYAGAPPTDGIQEDIPKKIGLNLGHGMVYYPVNQTDGLPLTNLTYFKVGFITKMNQGILLQVHEDGPRYMSLEMNNYGGVRFIIKDSFERYEINSDARISWSDSQPHQVVVRIDQNAQEITLQVDKEEPIRVAAMHTTNLILNNPKHLYVGNNATSRPFQGCIYEMQINDIDPLRLLFQYPRPSYIKFSGLNRDERNGFCEQSKTGVNLGTSNMIRYEFNETNGLPSTGLTFFRVGFITTEKKGVLLQVREESGPRYISLNINENGGVSFAIKGDHNTWALDTDVLFSFADGQPHVATVERVVSDDKISLKVDGHPAIKATLSATELQNFVDTPKYLYIGSHDTSVKSQAFEGCIYTMQIDNFMPLQLFYQSPRPSYISLTGEIGSGRCENRVGAKFHTASMIRYEPSTVLNTMYIQVGFITKKKQGILVQLRDDSNREYVSLSVNNNGGVKFFIDVGFERWEINTPVTNYDLTNGQPHVVTMRRDNAGYVYLQVDNDGAAKGSLGQRISDNIIDFPKYLFIGNNVTDSTANAFEGCLFNIKYDDIDPLEQAFMNPGSPNFIRNTQREVCGFQEEFKPLPTPATTTTNATTEGTTETTTETTTPQSSTETSAASVLHHGNLLLMLMFMFLNI